MAMLSHETNTFSTIATDRTQFTTRELRYGGRILAGQCRPTPPPPHARRGRARKPPESRPAARARGTRPPAACRRPRLLPPIASQRTAVGPMRRLYDLADEMERDPRVLTVSIFAGFPLADIH